jgi:hypothetical protein
MTGRSRGWRQGGRCPLKRRQRASANKKVTPRTRLRLPDLDHSKAAVLNSLRSPESQRGYRHSIDEFIGWSCSEPRLSFSKTVVTRYRIHLESRLLAAGTINGRLAAVRRLAYEAADAGLLSPELAAGIRRVKGAKRLGRTFGQLADRNRGPDTLAVPGRAHLEREAGSSVAGNAAGLRFTSSGTHGLRLRSPPASR